MTTILAWVGTFAGNVEIQKLLHTEVKEKHDKEKNPAEILPFKETKIRRL